MEKNFIEVVKFLFFNKVRNFVNSVQFGMGTPGVEKLLDDLKRLSTSDMLSVINMNSKSKINNDAYQKAVALFLQSCNNLSEESFENQKQIVTALGFDKVYRLFSDIYFNGNGNDVVRNIFASLTPAERQLKMTQGLFNYYGEENRSKLWETSPEIMEFLANEFVEYCYRSKTISRELTQYITDGYGLNIAYGKCVRDSKDGKGYGLLADIMDFASEEGIVEFLKNYADVMSMKTIQTTLFLEEKKTLPIVIKTIGCANAEIERYMLFHGILPEESVKIGFCFPQNFSMLMDMFGVQKVCTLFPAGHREHYFSLWKWVLTGRQPDKIIRTDCSDYEWQFVLADDQLCSQYIASGGKLTKKDIMTMLSYGKDNLIKMYRERN